MYALDEETGAKLWSYAIVGAITGNVVVADGVAYAASLANKLYAIDIAQQRARWVFEAGGALWGGPVTGNGLVFAGSEDDSMYAVDAATGELAWKYETGGNVYGGATLHSGLLLFTSYDGHLYALNASDGALRWRGALGRGTLTQPSVGDGAVYVGDFDGRVYAFEMETGRLLWVQRIANNVLVSPIVYDGTVLAGADDGNLYALDALDGALRWRFSTESETLSAPAVSDGVVYFGSSGDGVYAVDAVTGALVWNFPIGKDASTSAPVVVNDTVYIGSVDHSLYAIAAGIPPGAELSLSSTLVPTATPVSTPTPVPTPTPEFMPLSSEEAKEIIERIADLPGLGGNRWTPEGSGIISTVDEAFEVFETGYFLLTGKPSNWIPRVLTLTEYVEIARSRGVAHSAAYCCEYTDEGVVLMIRGDARAHSVISAMGHEAGHALQRALNPGQGGSPEIGALHEAQATAFQAALIRKLGEYTGTNATVMPSQYLLQRWIDGWLSGIIGALDNPAEVHRRGCAILWGAVLSDPELADLRAELLENRILSADSLIRLYNYLVYIGKDEADDYVAGVIESFKRSSQTVRSALMGRMGAIHDEGFFENASGTFLQP